MNFSMNVSRSNFFLSPSLSRFVSLSFMLVRACVYYFNAVYIEHANSESFKRVVPNKKNSVKNKLQRKNDVEFVFVLFPSFHSSIHSFVRSFIYSFSRCTFVRYKLLWPFGHYISIHTHAHTHTQTITQLPAMTTLAQKRNGPSVVSKHQMIRYLVILSLIQQ